MLTSQSGRSSPNRTGLRSSDKIPHPHPLDRGRLSPPDWEPFLGCSGPDWTLYQSKPLGQDPPPSDLEPLGQGRPSHSERCLGHPGVGGGSGSPQWAWQAVRTLFALSRGWSQVLTSPFKASRPSQAAGNT